jgi:hypothetical protein
MVSAARSAKRLLRWLYSSTYTNPVVARVRLILQRLNREYHEEMDAGLRELLSTDLSELRVIEGPFRGLRFPSADSLHSSLSPKLLGTYEKELHAPIERLLTKGNYDVIVDVGVAEGYYAVGLALRCPEASVFAYDIDPLSKDLLFEMARTNRVADRIAFEGECTGNRLEALSRRFQRGLLVSDCEGYELELLEPKMFESLSRWDILIETHDSLNHDITRVLKRRAQTCHRVTEICRRSRGLRDYPGPRGPSKMIRLAAMDEGRTWRSKWLCCESLSGS